MEGGSVLYNVVVPKCLDAPCSCFDSVHRLNAIEAGLASQIEALALKERMAFHIIFNKKHKRLECVPSTERSHIPPMGSSENHEWTQSCLSMGNMIVPRRLYYQLRNRYVGIITSHYRDP